MKIKAYKSYKALISMADGSEKEYECTVVHITSGDGSYIVVTDKEGYTMRLPLHGEVNVLSLYQI